MGYTSPSGLNGTSCEPCQVDYYKDIIGPSSCSPCPVDSTAVAGNRACACKFGFSGIPPFCLAISIVSGSLQLVNDVTKYNEDNELLLPTIRSGWILSFEVTGNWTLADNQEAPTDDTYVFTYGTVETSQKHRCLNITKRMLNDSTSRMECMISIGYGGHFLFEMLLWDGASFMNVSRVFTSHDKFSYPVITITSKTLREADSGSSGKIMWSLVIF
jgi:hypothetical protein